MLFIGKTVPFRCPICYFTQVNNLDILKFDWVTAGKHHVSDFMTVLDPTECA